MRRTFTSVAVTVAVVGAFAFGLALTHRGTQTAGANTVLQQVRSELRQSYYRPVPDNVLRRGSVSAMLAALHDPYTQYLDPTQFRLLRRETRSSYVGIGIGALPDLRGLRVVGIKPGPAKRAGVRAGDMIVSIGGRSAAGVPFEKQVSWILGKAGTSVRLGILRHGQLFSVAVVRDRISAPPVKSRLLADGKIRVGYLKVTAFRIGAAPVLNASLAKLRRSDAVGIVLDLRGNPGGVFDQAVGIASLFLDHGVIVTTIGAHEKRHVYTASPNETTRLPLIVLVNRDSASAAEIVAAALHDNRRAILVGEHTFGKGLVQTLRPLPNGAALKLTTARYITPAGADINLRGVYPDLHVIDNPSTPQDEVLQAALHLFVR